MSSNHCHAILLSEKDLLCLPFLQKRLNNIHVMRIGPADAACKLDLFLLHTSNQRVLYCRRINIRCCSPSRSKEEVELRATHDKCSACGLLFASEWSTDSLFLTAATAAICTTLTACSMVSGPHCRSKTSLILCISQSPHMLAGTSSTLSASTLPFFFIFKLNFFVQVT